MTLKAWRGPARALAGLVGLALIAYLVRAAGTARVAEVLWKAGSWLPVIVLLETVQIGSDVVALRIVLGARAADVPAATWVRSSAIAYAMMVLLPAGRVGGEVTRSALLARHVGAARAASASTRMQAAYLFANGIVSATACAVATRWLGWGGSLSLLLAANTLLMATFSSSLLAISRHGRVSRWIEAGRRLLLKSSIPAPAPSTEEERTVPWREALVCTAGRSAQTLQYAVILHAVGGVASVPGALIAHGIHLVGATVGDMIPNQLGVVDGVYRAFAAAVGFAGDPARALSIAFVAHIVQLLCGGSCIVVALLSRTFTLSLAPPSAGPSEAPPPSASADARS